MLAVFALGDDLVSRRSPIRSALVVLATIVATAANPFGLSVWSYVWDVSTNDTIRNTVAEWRPPSPLSAAGSVFWLSGIAVAALALTRRTSVRATDVARLLVFFALGAAALRSTVWWGLVAPPIVAGWLSVPSLPPDAPDLRRGPRVATLAFHSLCSRRPSFGARARIR